jgi:hypothetical protein
VIFNLISIDVAFIGTRTLLHLDISKNFGALYIITMALYTFMVLDLVEIGWVSGTLVYETQKYLKGWKDQ